MPDETFYNEARQVLLERISEHAHDQYPTRFAAAAAYSLAIGAMELRRIGDILLRIQQAMPVPP